MDDEQPLQIDCERLSAQALREKLNNLEAGTNVQLVNSQSGQASFGSGVQLEAAIEFIGDVGDFAFLLNRNADWVVTGAAGHACGHSMAGSSILIRTSAGDYFGACATGGLLVVHRQAGKCCGFCLQGGDIVVRGRVGDGAGQGMRDGVLALANGAGDGLGTGMCGGTIYVRGPVKSFAESVRKYRMKDADSMRLSLLLARAGIKGNPKEFSAYRMKAHKQ